MTSLTLSQRDRLISISSPVALLLIWEGAVRCGVVDARFFPAPSRIFGALVGLGASGALWRHTWASLQRLFWGSLIGIIPGLGLGLLMGLSRPLRSIVEPLVGATYPVPKSAIMPLLLLIFGLGEASKIAMVAIGAFYPVLVNAAAGVREIDRIYLDVGKNFNASRWQVFRTIALPGALPLVMTGIRLGIGMSLILVTVAEMVGARSGLGYMIWYAWEVLSVETMYAGLLTIAFVGFLLTFALNELDRWIIPWKAER